MKRIALTLILLLIPALALGASFVDDEFTGDLSAWTTGGNGTITTNGGYLSITSSDMTYDYIEQANITGAFDIVARLKDTFYPSESDSANFQCAFYVRIDDTNFLAGYQNRNDSVGKNEIMLQMYYGNVPTVLNPACDPMEYVCIRAKRDATNTFYIYKNSATDCSGDWTEVGETEYRLVSDAAVSVIIRARAPEASTTYLVDYVRTFGSTPGNSLTIEGGTLAGGSLQ